MTDPRIQEILDNIICAEKGFVDDPDDPGGATQCGISLNFAREIRLDLNHDGVTDVEDIKLVTVPIAEALFLDHFIQRPRIDTLPPEIEAQMSDISVNSGPPRAIILLQDVLDEVRLTAPELSFPHLEPDGVIGKLTRECAFSAQAAMGGYLNNALAVARERYMRSLAQRNPKLNKYIVAHDGGPGGWIKRARSFKVPV